MYLTYDDFINMGGTDDIEETTFQQLEFEARAIIDWWTFNRLQNETEYPEAVKRCMLKLISMIADKQKAMITDTQADSDGVVKVGIISESNDNVSASYNTLTAKDVVSTIQDELNTTVQMYLNGVRNSLGHKLLYRGVYPDE